MSEQRPGTPTDLEIYLFDLRGYLHIKNAISKEDLKEINACLDSIPPMKIGEWYGYVHAHQFSPTDGLNLQQIYEAGEPFEKLIDHPAWIEKVCHFVGGADSFDYNHGELFIDECFANLRGPGEAIGLHSGGHTGTKRTQFRFYQGEFHCGQINILMAFNDIGPGDGATMVIPGSHKAHFQHPQFEQHKLTADSANSVDEVEGAVELQMEAGDVLLFVDALSHGSARRTTPGNRRIAVYRYGPSWGMFRHPYQVSPELLARLTPRRRAIVMPHNPMPRVPNLLDEQGANS